MSTIWQRLGAFIATGVNLAEDQVARFAACGGRWMVPVIYGDDASGPWNLEHLEDLKAMGARHGVVVGGWFNCFGDDPMKDADNISAIIRAHGLGLVILDLESAYQFPEGNPELMPQLVSIVRKRFPFVDLGVSTNSLNDSMIYNGRGHTPQLSFRELGIRISIVRKRFPFVGLGVSTNILNDSMIYNGRGHTPQLSFRELGIRVLPQWYSWSFEMGPWGKPETNMKWLKEHGNEDNLYDARNTRGFHRAVPLSYVHGTLEVTGLEEADLAAELASLRAAKAYGFSWGFSIYLLEVTPYEDFDLLAQERGKLFLD